MAWQSGKARAESERVGVGVGVGAAVRDYSFAGQAPSDLGRLEPFLGSFGNRDERRQPTTTDDEDKRGSFATTCSWQFCTRLAQLSSPRHLTSLYRVSMSF